MKIKQLRKMMILVTVAMFLVAPAFAAEPIKVGIIQGLTGALEIYGYRGRS